MAKRVHLVFSVVINFEEKPVFLLLYNLRISVFIGTVDYCVTKGRNVYNFLSDVYDARLLGCSWLAKSNHIYVFHDIHLYPPISGYQTQ